MVRLSFVDSFNGDREGCLHHGNASHKVHPPENLEHSSPEPDLVASRRCAVRPTGERHHCVTLHDVRLFTVFCNASPQSQINSAMATRAKVAEQPEPLES